MVRTARTIALVAVICLILLAGSARADSDLPFGKYVIVFSAEGGFNHFGPRLEEDGWMQAWTFAGRLSIMPLAPFRSALLGHIFDGALETGVEPVYVRFSSQSQNYGAGAIDLRYHLLGLSYGPLVPWIHWMGGVGGTDLQVHALSGPLMFIMQAGGGVSWFFNPRTAVYLGYQYMHLSNADTEHRDQSLNSGIGAVIGVSIFLPH